MKTRILWFVILVLTFPAGMAAQSIHPYFQPDDLVFKPELLGEWKVDGEVVEFRDLGEKSYGAVLRDGDEGAICFRVRMFRIEQRYFLDAQVTSVKESERSSAADLGDAKPAIVVSDSDFELNNDDSFFINHQHLLLRVSFSEDKNVFLFSFQKEEWLRIQEESGKLNLPHTRDEDTKQLLLLAESDDLRAWVRELPEEAFDGPDTMKRAETKTGEGASMPDTSANLTPIQAR